MPVFLFTDIEGSTRLWEEHPAEMQAALATHDSILRSAIEGNGGSVVKTTGDGMMAVFARAASALAASVEAQTDMAGAGGATIGPILVRMGIHLGDAEERGGDYFGPAVNRTARIMGAAHGGQVLISGPAAEASRDRLPEDVELWDLGPHRLKDLTLPENLLQVIHPRLPRDFPALVTLDARPNNLPVQVAEFFGRAAELEAIERMLADPMTRLVTLTGPGGSGKTRLAIQAAAEAVDRFRDGVYFVDISQERQPEAVYEAMVRNLGVSPAADGDALQTLKTRLRDREMLVVLDNFEQVTDAAPGIADLLQACPSLKVIVTSRESLRVRAEHVFPVPPLELPDPKAGLGMIGFSEAALLFIDRARAVLPDFELDEGNAPVIAEICSRLDGLPLAIELAAARLNFFTPRELLDRLGDRLGLIGSGSRDLPERQRTLVSTIDWSYDLLDADERRMFELMSLFTTTDLAGLESVATELGMPDPLESLASLVDKSLVRGEESRDSRRFSMLRTIREYSMDRLATDPDRQQRAAAAHAGYYTSLAHRLRSGLQGEERNRTLADLEADSGNLRSAWRHWVEERDLENLFLLLDALWALLDAKGWYHTAIDLAGDLLDLISTMEPSPELAAEEMTLRTSLARALMAVYGWGPEVEETFQKIAADLEETDASAIQRFPVLRALSTYYLNLTQFEKGVEIGKRILSLAESESDQAMKADGLFVLGSSTMFAGQVEAGLAILDEAIELFDPTRQGPSRYRLGASSGVVAGFAAGLMRWQTGQYDRAREQVKAALDLAIEMGHPFTLAYARYHFGFFSLISQDFDDARRQAAELRRIAADNDYPVWRALSDVLEGVALTGLGGAAEGFRKTETGMSLYQSLSTPPVFWPMVLGLHAFATASAGDVEKGLSMIEEAVELVGGSENGDSPDLGVVHGDILLMVSEPERAAAAYRGAAVGAESVGLHGVRLRALTRLVELERAATLGTDHTDELLGAYRTLDQGFDQADMVAARGVLGLSDADPSLKGAIS